MGSRGNVRLPQGVYGITTRAWGFTHERSAQVLLEAGVKIIQYREKSASAKEMIGEARKIREACDSYGALFIVNDRVDVAYASDADGVHLGQEDLPLDLARRLLGDAVIGASASTPEEGLVAEREGASYLGAGSVFPSSTKPEERVLGIEGLKNLMKLVKIPVYAIGGIRIEGVGLLKSIGVSGVAVISAIFAAPDPLERARAFVRAWQSG
ncbi:MAG: thiamine phosphate synthase [Thermoprotei archaeon]